MWYNIIYNLALYRKHAFIEDPLEGKHSFDWVIFVKVPLKYNQT